MSSCVRFIVLAALAAVVSVTVPGAALAAQTRCEGFGTSTPGGAGRPVYRVTSLADDGPGTLRDAVSQGNRTVVFDVAGEISLVDQIFVKGAFITIDGTTAPAPGITLSRGGVVIRGSRGAHDVIVKGLRIRQAPGDGIQVAFGAYNVVVDGVSVWLSFDGNVDVSSGAHDVSVCWSLLAEPLSHTMLIGESASRVTMHNNLITRGLVDNPRVYVDEDGTPSTDTTLDMRNNVILNWDNGWGTAIHHGATANVVKNLYFSSASAPEDQANAIIVCKGDCNDDPTSRAWAYVAGNRSGTTLPFNLNDEGNETEPFPAPPGKTVAACTAAYRTVAGAGVRPNDAQDDRTLSLFVRIPSVCFVDLLITGINVPPGIQAGTTVPVDVLLKNRGPGAVEDPSTVRLFLASSNALTFDPSTAVEVGSAIAPAVGPDEVVTVTVPVRLPDSAGASGFYRLFAVADADDDLVETNESNNVTSADVRVGPDLIIDALTAPGWAQAGGAITVTDTVRNRGFSPSGPSKVRFYFSTSATVDPSAVVIGEHALASMPEGTTATTSTTVTVPLTAGAAGAYFVIAVVDPDAGVIEMDETNNTRATRVQVGPDLVVDGVNGPTTAMAGATITITDTTRNRGVSPATASITRFHISTKPAFDQTAIPIGQREVPALAAGATSVGPATVTIPAALGAAGTYYILAVADATNAVVEADEANNSTGPGWRVMIGPDLVVDSVAGPATAMAGATVTVTDTTRNRGVSPAVPTVTRFLISTKPTLDETAVVIGERPVPMLAAAATSTASTTVTIPVGLGALGSYYILATADATNAVVEADETNNTSVAAWRVLIGPDLVVDLLTGPSTAVAGGTVTITDTTRNRGVSPAAESRTRYFFSTKLTFDADAIPLGTRLVPALAPTAVSAGSLVVTLPSALAYAGAYYILAMADADNAVVEADETNNAVRAWRITIAPDLAVDAVAGPATAMPGETITVTDTVRNKGLSEIAPTTTFYYLSTKLTLDADAVLVGSRAVPGLAIAGVNTGSASIVIPPTAGAAGTYYLFALADGAYAVVEMDEFNNTRAARVLIGPDLVVDAVIAPVAVVAGTAITIGDTTRNRGVSAAPPTVTRFYLSSTPALTPDALLLGSRPIPVLAPAAVSSGTIDVTIPALVGDLGVYYIIAVADGAGAVSEPDESNNARPARVAIGPDLIIDSAIVPASAPAGAQFQVTDLVRNRGVGPAAASTLRFYLSTRKTHDPFLSIPLGTRIVPPLAAGESSSGITTLKIPASTPSGSLRYLIGIIDPGNRVTEMNEDNNGRYWVITIP